MVLVMANRRLEFVPPQNLEAEQAVLGSMMIDDKATYLCAEMLTRSDFYRPVHSEIFDVVYSLRMRGEPVDMIMVTNELKKRDKLDECGGVEYLIALHESVPTAANAEHYSLIVKDKSERRAFIAAAQDMILLANKEDEEGIAEKCLQLALRATTSRNSEWCDMNTIISDAYHDIAEIGKRKGTIMFGIEPVDKMTYGIERGDLVIIGARPSAGKTALANEIVLNACADNIRVADFSLETTALRLVQRMMYRTACVDSVKLRHGEYTDDEMDYAWSKLANAAARLHDFSDLLLLSDKPMSMPEIHNKVRRAVAQYANTDAPLGLVVVDYLQIINGSGRRAENRNVEIQNLTEACKHITQEFGVPVVALAQLKRSSTGELPTYDDLREGGNQEAAATKVLLLHNPPPSLDSHMPHDAPRPCVIRVAKHKDGPTGDIPCLFHGSYLRFVAKAEDVINA